VQCCSAGRFRGWVPLWSRIQTLSPRESPKRATAPLL